MSERKSKQSITKSGKTKLSTLQRDKLLKVLLYHQEMLVNMNFWQAKIFYQKKEY